MTRLHHGPNRAWRTFVPIALLAAALAAGWLLAACGGTDEGAPTPAATATAPAASASGPASASSPAASAPAPGSRPLAGSPKEAAAAYWALVDADAYERLATVCVPGSTAAVTRVDDDIARVRLLRVSRVTREAGGAQVQVDVHVTPADEATPWGAAGRHTLFMQLQESGPGWLVASWGTSP
jgi:hypothetical protein